MAEILRCPVCDCKLNKTEKSYRCTNNHTFDLAKEGYINLLMVTQKKTKAPGDTKEMMHSRRLFLSQGHYKKVSDVINQLILDYYASKKEKLSIIDLGCGEGYYILNFKQDCLKRGIIPVCYGLDLSKDAIKMAAKKGNDCLFIVANNFKIPVVDYSIDCVLSVFSPIDLNECSRVLKENGIIIKVTPNKNHLIELRELLYGELEEHEPSRFRYLCEANITYKVNLNREDIKNLLKMTPHYYKSTQESIEKVEEIESLIVTVDMHVGVFNIKDL